MTDTPLEINEDLTADQFEEKLIVIEIERRRTHLRLKLVEVEAERKIDFFIAAAHQPVLKFFRNDNEFQAALSLERGLKFKASDEYSEDTQNISVVLLFTLYTL